MAVRASYRLASPQLKLRAPPLTVSIAHIDLILPPNPEQ